jgi:eukaryotic-like serine/threonine-protein kinase
MVDMREPSAAPGVVPDVVPDVVAGRYRLREIIGAGGMGRVWLADDELLDRRVAIKEISTRTDMTASQMLDLQGRTMREARAAARLDHPGVITIYDVIWRAGHSWIVMEYVESRSLQDAVRADGPFRHDEAARIGLQVLSALRAAHAVGVMHRDVKPHNVLLADDGRVVLTDFGLATFEGADHGTEPLMGSPYFVAPERLKAGESGEPADLWSLGATLYAATEGRPPFARRTTAQSLAAVLADPPDPPRRPGPLSAVIEDLLVKDPAQRMSGFAAEARLRRIAGRSRIPAQRQPAATPGAESLARGLARVPSISTVVAPPPASPRSARRTRAGFAAAALLLAGAVGAAVLVNVRSDAAVSPARTVATPSVAATSTTPSAAINSCGFTDPGATAVEPDTGKTPYALPSGLGWYRDAAGFTLAVPDGWTRSASGGTTCFGDPAGNRALIVNSGAPVTRQPLRYWQTAEKAARADGSLPGYTRVSMGVLLLKHGGADWEYSWQPPRGPRQHTRRVLLATDATHDYFLQWTTRDQDWSVNIALQQRLVNSLQQSS